MTASEYTTTADRESIERIDTARERQRRVPVAGGVLVFEDAALGKELVGFEEVEDWGDVADALAARGLGRGAIYSLPEYDEVDA